MYLLVRITPHSHFSHLMSTVAFLPSRFFHHFSNLCIEYLSIGFYQRKWSWPHHMVARTTNRTWRRVHWGSWRRSRWRAFWRRCRCWDGRRWRTCCWWGPQWGKWRRRRSWGWRLIFRFPTVSMYIQRSRLTISILMLHYKIVQRVKISISIFGFFFAFSAHLWPKLRNIPNKIKIDFISLVRCQNSFTNKHRQSVQDAVEISFFCTCLEYSAPFCSCHLHSIQFYPYTSTRTV